MPTEYIIYADESIEKGKYFSSFYGGALVRSTDLRLVEERLQQTKQQLHLHDEIKWSKVTANYLKKYEAVMDTFFDLIQQDKVKVRIMFSQNSYVPINLTRYQRENSYFLLYYQFLKHAFGLKYANQTGKPIGLRLYLDRMPDPQEKIARFRAYLLALNKWNGFTRANLHLRSDQIAQVDSHDHVILQHLDVVLGAMQFRLNDKHTQKPEGARRRGKKTIAKEKLYKHIRQRICDIRPNFNIGITTGRDGDSTNLWHHSYRHWCFRPNKSEYDEQKTKSR